MDASAALRPRYVVLDVETTGLSASKHRVVELAVVTTDPMGRVTEEWSTRFNPQGPVEATHIHGITDADVRHAPVFADVVTELNQRLAGAAVVAHNARFDLAFLRAEYARARWRLPYVPALCTLEASAHYLPHLERRRLEDCCTAVGYRLHHAHSALADAHATAALLAHYLHPHVGYAPHPDHLRMPHDALTVPWPTCPETSPLTIDRPPATPRARANLSERAVRNIATRNAELDTASPRPTKPLVQLIERFSLTDALDEGAPGGALAYLEKLAEVLEDGVLTNAEARDLREVAIGHDLDDDAVAPTHRAFVLALAHEALADGKVTRAETDELRTVAALLDVDPDLVRELLARAEAARHARLSAQLGPLPDDWPHGEPLRVGDKVAFTGCDTAGRDELERRSTELGVRVLNSVSAKTAMLVTDGTMLGGKHEKAIALGTRMVDPDTYATLLRHLQPVATSPMARKSPTPMPTGATQVSTGSTLSRDAPAITAGFLKTTVDTSLRNGREGPSPSVVRAWGRDHGWDLGQRGRLPADLLEAYRAANPD